MRCLVTDTHATVEVLLGYNNGNGVICWVRPGAIERGPQAGRGIELREFSCGMFAGHEGPLSEAVTRKRLLILRAREDLVFEAVICKVWRLVIAL
jgi:hypothetical protein